LMPTEERSVSRAERHPALMSTWDRVQQMHRDPLPASIPRYEAMRQALGECRCVDEAKDIRDKAEALRAYARQRHDIELERWLSEIKLRAIRRIGEMSRDLEKSKGGRGKTLAAAGKRLKKEVLTAAGISLSAASRYQKLAAIPIQEFDSYMNRQRAEGKAPSLTDMLISVGKRRNVDRRANGMGDWFNNIHLADMKALRPGPLLRTFKIAREHLSDPQKFHLILGLLVELTGPTYIRTTQIDRWRWKLLARLLDIDAIQQVLEKLAQLPSGREQDAYLNSLMKDEDEPFLVVDFGDDLEPVLRPSTNGGEARR
ncbi:MAG: hypothetical protein ACRELF_21375, partial [Gemmataceae bacterium]